MKHITKISTLLIALTLAMSANAATKYCEKDLPSTQGESGTLTFTASKTGEKETTFTLTSTTSTFKTLDANGTLQNVALQNAGDGVTSTVWREDWTLENNTLTKVVTWTTYPTSAIQLLIVAKRDNSSGGSDIIGATFTDIDVSASCDGSGDTDKWSGVSWVPHVQYTDYAETFKVETGCATPINLQDRNGIGIYMTFSKPIKSCSVGSHFEGSGLWIYLFSLTQKETEVTVTFTDSTECSFWIYNEDGSTEEPTVSGEWITVPYNGFSEYTDRFQVKSGCPNTTVENIQNKNSRLSIYIHFSQVISDCNVDSYYSGSGLWVYLSALTAEETTVNVTFTDGSTCSFIVKNSEPGTSSSGTSTYCQTPLTSGDDCTIYVSNEKLSENNYRFTIEGEGLVDVHNTYYHNPANTELVQTSVTPEKIICDFTATSTPKFYTPLYIKTTTKDEVVFNDIHNKELVWGTCSSSDIPDVEVPEDDEQEDAGYCLYTGVAGDGQTSGAGRQTFQSGYNIAMWLNTTKDSINIRLELLANDITDADNAYFHNYPTYSTITEIDQVGLTKESDGVFIGVIPISFISNNVDGIMRFGLKVEYPRGVIRVTTPEYFYLDGSGCAQRVFAIYHNGDLPAEPIEGEDQFTEFAGGRILQSIQYKRRMPSEVWETLSVPFDVDSVTAFDPATGKHVRLYAQYNNGSTQAGNYWLRYFKTESVTRDNFQSNWHDIDADNRDAAKPEKDKAYIIRLPNGGGYYNDKYIVFHGRGYQEIAEDYIAPDLPQDDYYSYSGNNTMMPQYLSSAYVLDNAGYYFTSSSTVTLPPFECSVNATAATIAKMPRIALNGRNNTTTDLTLLPTTDLQGGVIYSIFGAAVARFNTIDEYDQACQTLAAGVYVIVTPSTTTKIQIP